MPAPARPVASTEARDAAMAAIRARRRPEEPPQPAASDRGHSTGYLLARQVIDGCCQARAERPPVSIPRQGRSLASLAGHGGAQGPCWRCGTAGAPRRPGMPVARAFMCDECMTG